MTALVTLWSEVRKRLEVAGVESPVLDARLLVEAGAGVSRLEIVTDPRRSLSETQVAAVDALTRRREAREPVSHILGRKAFWTLDLIVGPDVLTPRPETEFVVEAALELLPNDRPTRVLDLGVGSGAILLAILSARPDATGVGVDASEAALALARANGEVLQLGERIEWRVGDWDEGLDERFDLVVSNPPYIRTGAISLLQPEVARFEPLLALDGGADGLDAYRAIIPRLPRLLKDEGAFALEIGQGQAEAVWTLADQAGLRLQDVRKDLSGIPRVLYGHWSRPFAA